MFISECSSVVEHSAGGRGVAGASPVTQTIGHTSYLESRQMSLYNRSMSTCQVICSICKKIFLREIRHINEAKKYHWKVYCSSYCQSKVKNLQREFECENPGCTNKFMRSPHTTSPHNFCCASCAAIFNNGQRWGFKKKIHYTIEERKALRVAASSLGGINRWKDYKHKYSKEKIITEIQEFINAHQRIPSKRELVRLYQPARQHFGTWNNAIQAAGYSPNPLLFAKHHKALDGHTCDSLAEKIIDDYLFLHNISHERNIPYPEGKYTADFKIGNIYVEYFGLAGQQHEYDQLIEVKRSIAEIHKMLVLEIYPYDLYPENKLDKFFAPFPQKF